MCHVSDNGLSGSAVGVAMLLSWCCVVDEDPSQVALNARIATLRWGTRKIALILRRKMTMSSIKDHDSFSFISFNSLTLTMALQKLWDLLTVQFLCSTSELFEPEPCQPTQRYSRPTSVPSRQHSLLSVPSEECPALPFRRSEASESLRTPTRKYSLMRESRGSSHGTGLTDEDMRAEIRRLRGC
jgi:hypothetical protein